MAVPVTLQRLRKCAKHVLPAQLTQLLRLWRTDPQHIPADFVAAVITMNLTAQSKLLGESEAVLIFGELVSHFQSYRDSFEEILAGVASSSMFQMVFVNPWSKLTCVTCTGMTGFIDISTGERFEKLQRPAIQTVSINCTAALAASASWLAREEEPTESTE